MCGGEFKMYLMMQDINVERKQSLNVNINRRHNMSGIFNVGLESEETPAPVQEIIASDLIESMESMDVAVELSEVADLEARLDSANAAVAGLESAIAFGDNLLNSEEEVTASAVNALSIATETAGRTLGAPEGALSIGTENAESAEAALSVGMESMKDTLKKAWDAVKRVMAKIAAAVRAIVTKVVMKVKNLDKAYGKLEEKAKASKDMSIDAEKFKPGNLHEKFASFQPDGKIDAKVIASIAKSTPANAANLAGGVKVDDAGKAANTIASATDAAVIAKAVGDYLSAGYSGDVEELISGYGTKDSYVMTTVAKAEDVMGKELAEAGGLTGTDVIKTASIETKSITPAKEGKVEPLSLSDISNGSMKAYFKIVGQNGDMLGKLTSSIGKADSAMGKLVAVVAKSNNEDSVAKMVAKGSSVLMKAYSNKTSIAQRSIQIQTLNQFRTAVAVLSYMSASLKAYK